MKTTLNAIRGRIPCAEGWKKLLAYLGKTKADDEHVSIVTVLDCNGIDDALWCLRAVTGHEREIRLYAVWCARQVQHLMSEKEIVAVINVAERFANGDAKRNELTSDWLDDWAYAWDEAWDDPGPAHSAELRRVCECIDNGIDPYPRSKA